MAKPLVKVVWLDAQDYDEKGWASDEELVEFNASPMEVTSLGWLVAKSRHYITLAADFSPSPDTYGRSMRIPRKMVKSLEEVALVPTPLDPPTK